MLTGNLFADLFSFSVAGERTESASQLRSSRTILSPSSFGDGLSFGLFDDVAEVGLPRVRDHEVRRRKAREESKEKREKRKFRDPLHLFGEARKTNGDEGERKDEKKQERRVCEREEGRKKVRDSERTTERENREEQKGKPERWAFSVFITFLPSSFVFRWPYKKLTGVDKRIDALRSTALKTLQGSRDYLSRVFYTLESELEAMQQQKM